MTCAENNPLMFNSKLVWPMMDKLCNDSILKYRIAKYLAPMGFAL